MNKECLFLPPDFAIKLCEIGFNWNCLANYHIPLNINDERIIEMDPRLTIGDSLSLYYNQGIKYGSPSLAPTYQQAVDWFREEKKLMVDVYILRVTASGKTAHRFTWCTAPLLDDDDESKELQDQTPLGYLTYYEALLSGINAAINMYF